MSFELNLFVLAKAQYSNVEKISHLFLVLTTHQMFLKLVQLRFYGLYLKERYMKTIGRQKILIIWLQESNKKQKNVEEEMLTGMIEPVREKPRAV